MRGKEYKEKRQERKKLSKSEQKKCMNRDNGRLEFQTREESMKARKN